MTFFIPSLRELIGVTHVKSSIEKHIMERPWSVVCAVLVHQWFEKTILSVLLIVLCLMDNMTTYCFPFVSTVVTAISCSLTHSLTHSLTLTYTAFPLSHFCLAFSSPISISLAFFCLFLPLPFFHLISTSNRTPSYDLHPCSADMTVL